jgi:hypothetical protein
MNKSKKIIKKLIKPNLENQKEPQDESEFKLCISDCEKSRKYFFNLFNNK